jgi:hypothetical protein
MTTYEMADLAQNLFANSLSSFAVLLSVVFAYIVSAYLVGAKLTRMQVSMLTFVFVIVAMFTGWGMAAYVNGGMLLNQLAFPDSGDRFFGPKNWIAPFLFGMNIVVVLVPLKFMWDIRHSKKSNRG